MRTIIANLLMFLLGVGRLSSEGNKVTGTYLHQGDCLADQANKTALRLLNNRRFKASFWTCDTLRQISGRYEVHGDRITFIFDPPFEYKVIFRRTGRRLMPVDREKTFYGCGIREECLPEKDYYLKID